MEKNKIDIKYDIFIMLIYFIVIFSYKTNKPNWQL